MSYFDRLPNLVAGRSIWSVRTPKELTSERVKAALDEGFKDGCPKCKSRMVIVRTDEPLYEDVSFPVTCQDCGFSVPMLISPATKRKR